MVSGKDTAVQAQDTPAPVVAADGRRADGRACDELRSHFSASVGALTRSSGSAFVELGATQVAVAVHGPKPAEGRATGALHGPDVEKQQAEELLTEALTTALLLERCPKATVEVHCFVLECGGGEVAALLMAASLAAADAGIEARCLLPAATVVTVGPHMLVDPTVAEAARSDRSVLVAAASGRRAVAHVAASGHFAAAELRDALELAEDCCAFYHGHLRDACLGSSA